MPYAARYSVWPLRVTMTATPGSPGLTAPRNNRSMAALSVGTAVAAGFACCDAAGFAVEAWADAMSGAAHSRSGIRANEVTHARFMVDGPSGIVSRCTTQDNAGLVHRVHVVDARAGGRGAFHLPALRRFDELRVVPSRVEGRQAQGALSPAEGRREDRRSSPEDKWKRLGQDPRPESGDRESRPVYRLSADRSSGAIRPASRSVATSPSGPSTPATTNIGV